MSKPSRVYSKSFKQPDETRKFKAHGHMDLISFPDGTGVGRAVLEPGWSWSKDVQPIAKTKTCEIAHTGECLSGAMVVLMDNGEEFRVEAGEAYNIPAGHDAWTEGTESCILVEFKSYKDYAK